MQLTVTKGTKVIQSLEVPPGVDSSMLDNIHYFIGRSAECHVVIEGHHISRSHAQLSFIGNEWSIKKIARYGEVLLNGISVQEEKIKDGDIIQIADYHIGIILKKEGLENSVPLEKKDEFVDEALSLDQEAKGFQVDLEQGEISTDSQQEKNDGDDSDDLNEEVLELSKEVPTESEENQNEEEDRGFNFNQEEGLEETHKDDQFDEIDEQGLESSIGDVDLDKETKIIQSFIEFELNIRGEHTNFDKYYIKKQEVFIGRDPNKCQIVLDDPESSQVHAVIRRKGSHCELEDLGSTNGIILNGSRVNQGLLSHGDKFSIGSTSFQFVVKSEFIHGEKSRLMPIESVEEVEVEEVVEEEVDVLTNETSGQLSLEAPDAPYSGSPQSKSLFSKEILRDPEKRKKILIYVLVAVALWVFLDEGSTEKKKTVPKERPKKDRKLVKDRKENESTKTKKSSKRDYNNLPKDLKNYVQTNYELAKIEILEYGNFDSGLQYLDKINEYVDEFQQSKSLTITAKEELKKFEEVEKEKKRKQEEEERKIRVGSFLKKANEAFDNKQTELVQSLLNKVAEIDPENLEGSQLKLQLDVFIKEKERKAIELAQKKGRRERLVNELKPGKTLYLKEEWYQAIIKLESFLEIKDNDDDLISETTKILKESRSNLQNQIFPLLSKARSLDEGKDYKGAYETYKEILKIDPSNTEAIFKMDKVKGGIEKQAKRIYREAIIDESLNYLKKAKEKFQEVQQITPADSSYHKRATNKLEKYTAH